MIPFKHICGFFKLDTPISCKNCKIHRCTHMALGATTKMAGLEQEVIPPSDSEEEEYISENSNNNIDNYDPPPFPSDNDSEGISNDSNEAANEHDKTDGPNSYRLSQTPIVNYSGDYEDQDDYFDGWIWNRFPGQEDSGPEYRLFLGSSSLYLI